MTILESLNSSYQHIVNSEERYRKSLVDYIESGLAFSYGQVNLSFEYKSYNEADKAGEDFDQQFPVSVCIEDRHGFRHCIHVTALYKVGSLYHVDGYDTSDGQWVKGWYTDDLTSTYGQLACFINKALNPEGVETPGDKVAADDESGQTGSSFSPSSSLLVGYQLLDEYDFGPYGFTGWDVFLTPEDADTYRKDMLDPDEWRIEEVWESVKAARSRYTTHSLDERQFKAGENVCVVTSFGRCYAEVLNDVKTRWTGECLSVKILMSDGQKACDSVNNRQVMQQVQGKTCPDCGKPLYRAFSCSDDNLYCPECGRHHIV